MFYAFSFLNSPIYNGPYFINISFHARVKKKEKFFNFYLWKLQKIYKTFDHDFRSVFGVGCWKVKSEIVMEF
jgi:hypothetical protein